MSLRNENRKEAIESILYGKYKTSAKSKNLEFNLGLELFVYLIYQKCYYCNFEPSNIAKDRFIKNNKQFVDNNMFILYNGIDRVDSSLGYNKENVVACCKYCNSAKSDQTPRDFIAHIKRIYNHYIKGQNLE